ncbi:MAG: phosphatidate cytidylyltransferase, partial [Candidatus Xenobia bacterium]
SLGGLLTSIGVSLAWSLPAHLPALQAVVIGLAAGLAAQLGDLWESVLKRDAGVKDAGKLIPGHGCMLDRFDSFFFATPVVYYLVRYVILKYHWL